MALRGASGVVPDMLAERAALLATLRGEMAARGMLEVDTALLSPAAPCERALECLAVAGAGYLVPSPEHGLKRLLVETRRSLYQLGHVFRAGEVGRWHNPEFTMLEWYEIGASMQDAVDTLGTVLAAAGAPALARQRTYRAVFADTLALDPLTASLADLQRCADAHGVTPPEARGDRVFWLDLLMGLVVQPRLGAQGPEIVTYFPADDAVLIALDGDDARVGQRFECFWQGIELANGAKELTDPRLARQRMQREQDVRIEQGQAEPPIDERLLAAMATGLPECAGVALGVDRLLALLTGKPRLAEVIPFAWPAR